MSGPDPSSRSRAGRPVSSRRRARDLARHHDDAADDADEHAADGDGDGEELDADDDEAADGAADDTGPGLPAAIATTGLTKAYGDAVALAPLDLRIAAGTRVSLIGHNGSGKTTLLRMLAGVLLPTAGTATVAGQPAGSLPARATVSYLADRPVFYDDLSVWEHLEYVARLHGTDDWEQQAVDLVEMVGLYDRVDDLPTTFSRGLQQKAAIAIAFVRPFDVLLVDEPFVGLDRRGRRAMLDLFDLAHGDGATLVVATHELSTVDRSSRLVCLAGGEVVFDGDPSDANVADLAEGVVPDAGDTAS